MEEREMTQMVVGKRSPQIGQTHVDYEGRGLSTHQGTGMSGQLLKWSFSASREALARIAPN